MSSFASFGYGQDAEGDDHMGSASLGGVYPLSDRLRLGLDGRARFQLVSTDMKFDFLTEPAVDFGAGPLLAYSIGAFDLTAQGGMGGVVLKGPKNARGDRATLQLGPLVLLGIGAAL